MRRALALNIAILYIVGLLQTTEALAAETINFGYCLSSESTNCIEGLTIIKDDNTEVSGTYIPGTSAEFDFQNIKFASGDGRAQMSMSWRPDGAPLCWWGNCDYHAGSIDMVIFPTSSLARLYAGTIKFDGENQKQCGLKENPTECGKWFNFGANYNFAFKFRATGFNIGMVSGRARDVSFKDLNAGSSDTKSHTYEIVAKNVISDSYIINDIRDSQPRDRQKADYYSDGLIMWFWDVNNSATSRLPEKCNAAHIQGPPTQLLFNTFNMGSPTWNVSESTLSVQLESSHLAFDGSLNKGFYEMVFSKQTAECLWGINPEKSARAEVKISYSDGGTPDIAAVTQGFKDGLLKITASNFHLSAPIISTKLVSTETTTQIPSKKIQILCTKGTVVKKILGVKPVCPKGFKKG